MEFLLIFFFGTLWGSFFYTLSIRFIDGSIKDNKFKALFSKSKCPNCNTKISPLHLIPVAGYLILRGKCKDCNEKLSILYPVSEILFGILLLLVTSKYGINIYSLSIFLIIGLALTISMIDLKTMEIPGSLVLIFLLFSIYPVVFKNSLLNNLYGLLLMGLFFLVILLIFPGSFGGGDLKFAAAIGALMGLELSIVVLEISLISGSLIGVMYGLFTKRGLRIKIPFAPFLTFGTIISLLYGEDIVLTYYRLLF